MAVYAALVSLASTIHNIQNHPLVSTFVDKHQIESLTEKVALFLDFVENSNSHGVCNETADLECRIASAAHEAEDVIESHIVNQILARSNPDQGEASSNFKPLLQKREIVRKGKGVEVLESSEANQNPFNLSHFSSLFSLQKVMLEMESVMEKVLKVQEERGIADSMPPAALTRPPTTAAGKTTMVGFDGYLVELLERLTGQQPRRQIIPVMGMGGIGKTTLARNVYENSLTLHHFDVRAWVAISQEYNVRNIVLEILSCLGECSDGELKRDVSELGEKMYKILFGRRYLIVLDDMWSVEVWDKIRSFFPENYNRSRIVVTSRQLNVANHLGDLVLDVNFLDDDRSWDLFSEKAFAQECCPPELEDIGKRIVKKCRGLPLAIVVIEGLLGRSSRNLGFWKNVERNLSTILNSVEDSQCLNLLSLSYTYLPARLKPCFLYLGIYPEDHNICVSWLIKLWIAEGFLKPNAGQSLEEVGEDYIEDLVGRNLVSVRSLYWNGKIKSCSIHDLLRDLCINVAEREKFFCVLREPETSQDLDRECRVLISNKRRQTVVTSSVSTRSVISKGFCELSSEPRLLRVLVHIGGPLDTDLLNVNLRFLENTFHSHISVYRLPRSIWLLWNLQTLIMEHSNVIVPSEIWDMSQLRHFHCGFIFLPDPPARNEQDCIGMQNLQTLGWVNNFKSSKEVCQRMHSIKDLRLNFCIYFSDAFWDDFFKVNMLSYYCLHNLSCLNKLESLHFKSNTLFSRDDLVQNLILPSSLKRLTLVRCKLHWDDLVMFGSLPHLEALTFEGHEWSPVAGEFGRLKFLKINACRNLISWNAGKSHFPVLEELVLIGTYFLDEIPLDMGDIDTLRIIRMDGCKASAAISAVRILEEQESLGNESLFVEVKFWEERYEEEFHEQVEGLNFPRHNFQLLPRYNNALFLLPSINLPVSGSRT